MDRDPTDVLGRRIGAGLLDIVAAGVLLVVVGIAFGQGHSSGSSVSVELHGTSVLVWGLLVVAYYFVFEAGLGATPGKMLMGLRVVGDGGVKASPGSIAVRTLLRIVDVLPAFYLLGLIVVLASGARRKRLGDLIAGTSVRRA
jgi:uncharacterized RDD family membrane protein YckC